MGDGVGEGSFKSRFFTRRSISIPNPYTPTAPAMTKRSAGSHAPKRSRNPITRAGSVIPERASPVPKRPHQLPRWYHQQPPPRDLEEGHGQLAERFRDVQQMRALLSGS